MSNKALLVIDVQNDYFPSGKYPLCNTTQTLNNIMTLINTAKSKHIPVILIQHVSVAPKGSAAFFEQNSEGVGIHPQIIAIVPDAPIVEKHHADSFIGTTLEETLRQYGVNELLLCGMMTQNCVTHTAISQSAEKYKVSIIKDCCTSVDPIIHNVALNAVVMHVPIIALDEVI